MGRADELLPIDRSGHGEGLGLPPLTDELRTALTIEEVDAGGVRAVLYRPRGASGPLPVLFSIHGGAFCFMSPEDFAGIDATNAAAIGCAVLAVDYRLAPEHPFPAGLDDCWCALAWVVGQPWARRPLVVKGDSAGGALAAALCQRARDEHGPAIDRQVLLIPVIDDRLDTPSMRAFGGGHPGFNAPAAEGMWLHYLGEGADRSATPPYGAPGRAEDLSGLPPAVIQVHGMDPLRDEGIDYARGLLAAGVSVELHVVPGAHHGAPGLEPAAEARCGGAFFDALRHALMA